ncbi:MAG: class A beta-lactamase [Pseudomonadota bacterium]
MLDRRKFLIATGATLVSTSLPAARNNVAPLGGPELAAAVRACETASGGRLGVAILDVATAARFSHRGNERFPMCSTVKLPLAAAILRAVDQGRTRLDNRVPVSAGDILGHSPFSETRVGGTASLAELCEATLTLSDNAAANLLLPVIGGLPGLTRFARTLGDTATRFDRNEPDLNEGTPGDPRDTTTPVAMLGLLNRMLLGSALSRAQRARLTRWMIGNHTGDNRLRAGLPAGWRVGDKTGTGGHGSNNDIAILWPPARAPLLVTSYLTGSPLSSAASEAIHARLARSIARL